MDGKPTYEELEKRLKTLEKKAIDCKKAEETLQKRTRDLDARIKGLNCLYGISNLAEKANTSFEQVAQGAVDLIAAAWQYPEIACARILLRGQAFKTKNFKRTRWKQSCKIVVQGEIIGTVAVYYLAEKETSNKGPFLREESVLIKAVAGRIGRISEWMWVEKALQKSEEKYRLVVENANEGINVAQDGVFKLINPKILEYTGCSEQEMRSQPFVNFVHPHDKNMIAEHHRKVLIGERKPSILIYRIIDKNGRTRWIENNGVLINWEGRPATLNFMSDITERRKMEDALYTSETQKQAILDASIDRLRYVDKEMKIIWANQTTVKGLDISPEKIKGQTCYKLFVGRDTPCKGCPTVKALVTGKIERAIMHRPGANPQKTERFWDTYIVPLKNKTGDIESFIQVARDITDQQKTKKRIYKLTHELLKAQENERKMISRELHDSVAQDLSVSKMACDMVLKGPPKLPGETKKKINKISNELQKTITSIRDLSYELRPASLDQMGLIETIFQYCEEFSKKTGLSTDFTSAGMDSVDLNVDTEINLYRLVQEGLNNIRKHAQAKNITIRLAAAYPNILLRIIDDGKGFDVQERMANALSEKRMGLRSMEERTHLLQGSLEIRSRPAQGTKILIVIPQKEKKRDE